MIVKRIAILVTGSRCWTDEAAIKGALAAASVGYHDTLLIHGDARGADAIAGEYGEREYRFRVVPMPAQWVRDGKLAGPFRNGEMIDVLKSLRRCGYDCVVLAFPLSPPPGKRSGTQECIDRARRAGFVVRVFGDLTERDR